MSDPTVIGGPATTGEPGGRRGRSDGLGPDEEDPISPNESSSAVRAKKVSHLGDRIFSGLATGSGVLVVLVIAAIGLFLVVQAIPGLHKDQVNFFTSRVWDVTTGPNNLRAGVVDLVLVTVVVSLVALVIAMPVSLGIALFITQYAPRGVARTFAYVVDLLAAVPSIIFGLWGIYVLAPFIDPIQKWINDHLGFIPIFGDGNVSIQVGGTIFTAGVVVAAMLLPIITAVTREVFSRTPVMQIEGALALGATKWEMIRTTVLPFGRAGFVSASMLGLGRALGETIAIMIILAATNSNVHFGWSLFDGGDTIASRIARDAGELDANNSGLYIAAGLVLFVLTFAVNAIARAIVADKKDYA